MRKPSPFSRDSSARTKGGEQSGTAATETAPLLPTSAQSFVPSGRRSNTESHTGSIRSRRSSRSPTVSTNRHFGSVASQQQHEPMSSAHAGDAAAKDIQTSYDILPDDGSRTGSVSLSEKSRTSQGSNLNSQQSQPNAQHYTQQRATDGSSPDNPPLLEIPEEIYGVRKAALQVLKPLTKTWLVVSVGFALTVLFGMARWTGMLIGLPFWFILLPSWCSHVGLFWCHLMSAKALSSFIAEANDSRQRPDSRDHLDRTEYLPLLQRSLKFGLKTGLVSFGAFIFEILVYVRLAHGKLSMAVVFLPLWIIVLGGVLDGIICKTQHFVRLLCWLLIFSSMILACLKVDFGVHDVRWRMVMGPIIAVLCISSGTLIYIIYGHQVGYYMLTEAQLTAGNLYSLAALISIVLLVLIGEVIPLARPVEIETRVFVVLMAPLVVTLVGMGAWVVSRDEFGRLLLYGGQAAVHPRRLRWESNGWTSVQGRGVTNIPMFGEVSKPSNQIEQCMCCSCYPYEEDEEEMIQTSQLNHAYFAPSSQSSPQPSYLQYKTQGV